MSYKGVTEVLSGLEGGQMVVDKVLEVCRKAKSGMQCLIPWPENKMGNTTDK